MDYLHCNKREEYRDWPKSWNKAIRDRRIRSNSPFISHIIRNSRTLVDLSLLMSYYFFFQVLFVKDEDPSRPCEYNPNGNDFYLITGSKRTSPKGRQPL